MNVRRIWHELADRKGVAVIRHLVFMKYADSVPQQARDALMHDLADLRTGIDGMEDFHTGRRNVSTTLRQLVFEFRLGLAPFSWAG